MEAQPQMSDGLKIALTASFTVLGGLLIFVLQEFFLKPAVEQNKVIGLIGSKLLYYRPMLANPIQMPKKADELLRDDTRFANDPDQARAAKRAEDTAAAQQRQFEEYIDISKEIRELTGNWQRLRTPSDGSG